MYKNNKLKKSLSMIIALVVCLVGLSVGWVALGDDLVAINENNFPDENWRTVVSMEYDRNGDGFLSLSERTKPFMSISGYLEDDCGPNAKIESLVGIELFNNVQRLYVGSIGLKTLDVSSLKSLTQLTCQGNSITTLRVGNNDNLTWINCASNELTSVAIGGCPSLTRLDCYANHLTSINVSANSALQELFCQDNDLTSLNVSSNSNLSTLYCSNNHITRLDLSENELLSEVTQSMIGDQTAYATAQYAGSTITVPFSLTASRVVTTSLDTITEGSGDQSETIVTSGYSSTGNFITKDATKFKVDGHDGDCIVYEYDVNNSAVENMNVIVSVSRSFSQVRFFTDESKTELLKTQFVNNGSAATAPTITQTPQGKIFGGWSDDFTNVNEDKDIYVRWINPHIWQVVSVSNGDISLHCTDCGDDYVLHFIDYCNLRSTDMNYIETLDIVSDGIINAKDYAKLYNLHNH